MGASTATTAAVSHATSTPVNIPSQNFSSVPSASTILSGSNSVRVTESTGANSSSSPVILSTSMKVEELEAFLGVDHLHLLQMLD